MRPGAMDPGERDQRVVVRARQTVDDAGGGRAVTWVDIGGLWVHVKPVAARESERQGGMRDGVVYLMTADALSARGLGLAPEHVIAWNGKNLNVREVRTAPASVHEVEIVAETGVTL